MSDPLRAQLKQLIVRTLKLDDLQPEDIGDDALELVVTLEKEFGIKISSSEESRAALASVAHLADFVRSRAPADRVPA